MSKINHVPASAGAAWLLESLALLRKAPLQLGLLGLIYGLLSVVVNLALNINTMFGLLLQLALIIFGPVLMAGFIWAISETEQGRHAEPKHFLHAVEANQTKQLLLTLLPNVLAGFIFAILFLLLIGAEGLENFMAVMKELQQISASDEKPDPALFSDLPVIRLFLMMVIMCVMAVIVLMLTFVAVPDIVFAGSTGIQAMRNSLNACVHNLFAIIVMFGLLIITSLVVMIAAQIVNVIVQLVLGAIAGQIVAGLLMTAVLMPIMAGTMYCAWKKMLGEAIPNADIPTAHLQA